MRTDGRRRLLKNVTNHNRKKKQCRTKFGKYSLIISSSNILYLSILSLFKQPLLWTQILKQQQQRPILYEIKFGSTLTQLYGKGKFLNFTVLRVLRDSTNKVPLSFLFFLLWENLNLTLFFIFIVYIRGIRIYLCKYCLMHDTLFNSFC